MSIPDDAHDPPSAGQDKDGSARLRVRALAGAARGRFEGSSAQTFLSQLGALDFANSIILFGSALLSQLFRSSPAHSTAAVVTALILATAGTIAVASSLQVIYERVFGQQHRGWKDVPRFVTWAGVLFGVLVADSVISDPVRAAGGPAVQGLVIYAGVAAFFWWTMHFLLAGRVSWRLLLRPAILTALFWIGLELFSSVYFSASIISDSRLYGTIGVVFSLMIWFTAIGAVIVLGAVAGATWNQHKGHSRRARA